MNLAIVTPLPPQQTGIVDYAIGLVNGLRDEGFNIDLFTNIETGPIAELSKFKIFNLNLIDTADCLEDYDLVIFHMGNNGDFHLYMLELLEKYGGIVHLHDLVLHHLVARLTYGEDNAPAYYDKIAQWYGYRVRYLIEKMISNGVLPWETELVTDLPLFAECLQYAEGCIVHSEYAQEKIVNTFPELPTYRVDQLYPMDIPEHQHVPGKSLCIGVFGRVDPHKRVDVIIKVLAQLKEENPQRDFHLVIVGSIDIQCEYLYNMINNCNLDSHVKITGRVSNEEFQTLFADIDVLIALRYPTMGETSAVVMQALQRAIPVIVNDIGWYHELPSLVNKISIDHPEEDLLVVLRELVDHRQALIDLQARSVKYRDEHLEYAKSIQQYGTILRQFSRVRMNSVLYKQLAPIFNDLTYLHDPVVYTPVLKRLVDVFT